jgi:hypothetical protein
MRYTQVSSTQKYGKLTVQEQVDRNPSGHIRWLCNCECGGTAIVTSCNLRNGHTQSCGCLRKQRGRENFALGSQANRLPSGIAAKNALYARYRNGAQNRQLQWDLTKKDFEQLTQGNCFYCNREPEQENNVQSNTGSYIYNGIDRVNNSKGYTTGNCVSCCKQCNIAKGTLSLEEFLEWINKVSLAQVIRLYYV